ncbi:MAG: hypothetical protein M3069_30915 [Chloroflexota bacterium]|nr:hypothetical protein [Chloroflexota bacterium]
MLAAGALASPAPTNQFGDVYGDPRETDQGDANLIFNTAVRSAAADYVDRAFAALGTDFGAVRLGGGRWGELSYPPAKYNGHPNAYWGFDLNAVRLAPTYDWRPGQPQPDAEASVFINWYLDALVDYQNWQIATVRRSYAGLIMMLYPGWGIRPGQLDEAIHSDLNGSSSGEVNGELEGGFDFARQIAAITDARVVVTTTWLDADASHDSDSQSRGWSPVKYLASLANAHPLKLQLYGENTGHGSIAAVELAVHQVRRFGLIGMAWFNESEVLGGQSATLADLASIVGSAV